MRTVAALAAFHLAAFSWASGPVSSIALRDTAGKPAAFSLLGKPSVLVFVSTQCPISNEYNERMMAIHKDFSARGVQILFVNANRNESLGEIAEHAKAAGFPFAVYKDPRNALADQLGATVTPEAFLFDAAGVVRYRGNIDDARNPARAQVAALRDAIEAVLASRPVLKTETKAFGCTIKRVKKST